MRPEAVRSAALLREARVRSGLTQAALAERSGKDRVQINRYEAGAVAPNLDTLIELVRACGFDLPLELVPLAPRGDDRLGELQQLPPERRLDHMHALRAGRSAPRVRKFDPRAILAALERNYVDYVLIGGLAQVLRGADLVTRGVDICPSFAAANVKRLARAADELNAKPTGGGPLAVTGEALDRDPVLSLSTPRGTLQIVGSPAGAEKGYVDLRRAATKEHLGRGLRPLVASTGDLARMAAALHRDRDLPRLAQLRRMMELESDRAGGVPRAEGPARRKTGRATPQRGRRLAQ